MTMWHCVVDRKENLLCNGTPEWDKEPVAIKGIVNGEKTEEIRYYTAGTCKLLPDTCGRARIPEKVLLQSSYTHKVILKEKEKESDNKPKSKAVKKLEKEMAQNRLF